MFTGGTRNSKLLLYVAARARGAEDWWKGHKITTTDYEEHHIIPRSLLIKYGYNYSLIDDTANIAFLTEKANRRTSNANPVDYLSDIDPGKLRKQFVPMEKELWNIKNFQDFIQHRRRLIVESVNELLKGLDTKHYLKLK